MNKENFSNDLQWINAVQCLDKQQCRTKQKKHNEIKEFLFVCLFDKLD